MNSIECLSGKVLKSTIAVLKKVEEVNSISDIPNCKKLIGYNILYRIRVGSNRAIFAYGIIRTDGIVRFELLLPRGQAYKKEITKKLRELDES